MMKEMTTCTIEVLTDDVLRQVGGEDGGGMEHDGETFDEQTERSFLDSEAIEFALTVTAAFNHRCGGGIRSTTTFPASRRMRPTASHQ